MKTFPSTPVPRLCAATVVVLVSLATAQAAREEFQTPGNGANLGVWRITNDPTIRDWANYHNTQCWSPDGRYICYAHHAPELGRFGDHSVEVQLYDTHKDESRLIERGFNPRWARHHNWLFQVRLIPRSRAQPEPLVEVRWLDLETGAHTTLARGDIEALGETTFDDKWLLGAKRFRGQQPEFVTVRIGIGQKPAVEELRQAVGAQLLPNPRHPVFFTRQDHKGEAFGATRWFYDLDGGGKRMAVPTLQQCHMSWLGNGDYLLMGNGLVRGRRWDQPFPSNVDVLAGVGMGDISPCGRSGRYVCGDKNVADLRSGDGWHFIEPLSMICYPAKAGDQSGNYDADPKGSPDGTKICFVTNYDLKDGPLTHIAGTQNARDGVLRVASTAKFPAAGLLNVQAEVIRYTRKTDTTFEGLTRGVYETRAASFGDGAPVTSFDARFMTDAQWRSIPGPTSVMRRAMDEGSPLLRQRQTDVHVAVVRRPDRPFLRAAGNGAQLIPGEEHFETRGYHLLLGNTRITRGPITPGGTLPISQPGEYRAVAVEWSGLESDPSLPVQVSAATTLRVLRDPPADFSWTAERWLIGKSIVTQAGARQAAESIREIMHRHDGVIHREWYQQGVIVKRHDLNAKGKPTRQLAYQQGRLSRREYFEPDGDRVSTELFDADGFITESIRYRGAEELDHWWFERGMPVRQVTRGDEFFKQGDQWISKKTGKSFTRE